MGAGPEGGHAGGKPRLSQECLKDVFKQESNGQEQAGSRRLLQPPPCPPRVVTATRQGVVSSVLGQKLIGDAKAHNQKTDGIHTRAHLTAQTTSPLPSLLPPFLSQMNELVVFREQLLCSEHRLCSAIASTSRPVRHARPLYRGLVRAIRVSRSDHPAAWGTRAPLLRGFLDILEHLLWVIHWFTLSYLTLK